MTIQTIVEDANKTIHDLQESGGLSKRILAVGIEINQRYLEYLDDLETADLGVSNGVRVEVDGQVIQFKNTDDFAAWLAENCDE